MRTILISAAILAIQISAGCSAANQGGANELARAPIVGLVAAQQVQIALKAASNGKIRIAYREAATEASRFSAWKDLKKDEGYSASIILKNIRPATEYDYRAEFGGGSASPWYQFTSFPAPGKAGIFQFAFSACFRERYKPHYIFDYIQKQSPTFVALLGDNMYGDYDGDINKLERLRRDRTYRQEMILGGEYLPPGETVIEALRNKYHRNFDEYFQGVSNHIPIMAIWDDHDYGQDNSDGTYRYKDEAKQVFLETFPTYPYETKEGGLHYRFSVADVDFFVLDTRWYRTAMQVEDGPDKTMLGQQQLEWLLAGLKASKAAFKMILSSVSWNDYGGDTSSGRPGFDSWRGYLYERNKILAFIEDEAIPGVLIFSGDQHYPSAHILNWKPPLRPVSKDAEATVYSLKDLGTAVIDFSASPLSYHRAAGENPLPGYQDDPSRSYEIFRSSWGFSGPQSSKIKKIITAVYGYVEVDTRDPVKRVTVTFKELDWSTSSMKDIYQVQLLY